MLEFPTDNPSILARLKAIDPGRYAKTRNYLNGAVTGLSPYLTHGVLGTREVGEAAIRQGGYKAAESLLKELAWHDFYAASWSELGDVIFSDLRYPQPNKQFNETPTAVLTARTGITAIDQSVSELLATAYLHNHSRLWLAMLCSTIARTAWWNPSRWMYYHLLDGNLASNTLSWQWVAGSSRSEPYIANQENLNTYSGITQHQTFLDHSYEELAQLPVPEILQARSSPQLATVLPTTPLPTLTGEVLLYHPWSLSPSWYQESRLSRVLLLEPDHFTRFPMSEKRINFILSLAKNISGLTLVVSNFSELSGSNPEAQFRFIQHPTTTHWNGVRETVEPLFRVKYPITSSWSFSKFWSKCSITVKLNDKD